MTEAAQVRVPAAVLAGATRWVISADTQRGDRLPRGHVRRARDARRSRTAGPGRRVSGTWRSSSATAVIMLFDRDADVAGSSGSHLRVYVAEVQAAVDRALRRRARGSVTRPTELAFGERVATGPGSAGPSVVDPRALRGRRPRRPRPAAR